jgi:toxin ParE1/3/4
MHLRLSPRVPGDLEEIAGHVAQNSPRHAVLTLRVIRSRINEIVKQPELYRLQPELGADARSAVVGQYVIFFRIRQAGIRIERVVHGSRDLLPMLDESEP